MGVGSTGDARPLDTWSFKHAKIDGGKSLQDLDITGFKVVADDGTLGRVKLAEHESVPDEAEIGRVELAEHESVPDEEEIGRVKFAEHESVPDEEEIGFLVVDLRGLGEDLILPGGMITRIDLADSKVFVPGTKASIKQRTFSAGAAPRTWDRITERGDTPGMPFSISHLKS